MDESATAAEAAGPPDITRPQTSTRDRTELRERLQQWLGRQLPPGADAQVPTLEIPPGNGMSSETLLFDATWQDNGQTTTESFVARVAPDPSAIPVFPVYDLDRQFRVMKKVRETTKVPVPRVWWSETDSDALGAPFFVMERIEGHVPPDIMPYTFGDNWLFNGTTEQQARLQESSVRVLADLHAVPDPEVTFAFLQIDRPGDTALRRHYADQIVAYYEWAGEGIPFPLLERCFARLEQTWPKDEGPTAFSWGDARIGNMMFRDFEPVAVLDWEMAALAPREIDLAWFIYLNYFFQDLAVGYGMPGLPNFMRRDDVCAAYERMSRHTPRNLDFYTLYAATRYGVVSIRTSRRGVHFGEREMPDDVDDLIMHRSTLEAMLAGTYWDSVGG
jgi:aminoglycoside phosphotransferase (APT) family kinase protein